MKTSIFAGFLAAVLMMVTVQAHAGDIRVGGTLGFGGAGISTSVSLEDPANPGSFLLNKVDRSEGPGVASIFADTLLSDTFTFGIEHVRGFRLGPASSGVSFTGVFSRWYWSGFAPSMVVSDSSTLLVKRFTPFVGLMTGLGTGTVQRSNDLATQVDGSGIYFGIKLGVDYPLAPGVGIRPEISTAATILSQGAIPTTLSLFALQCGLYFNL